MNQRGLTRIELLVVLAVLTVLAVQGERTKTSPQGIA